MKAVMLAVQPKWVEKIANKEKTIEVRKTAPKCEEPFKCYIYCTSSDVHSALVVGDGNAKLIHCCNYKSAIPVGGAIGNGKVIGEFICDKVMFLTPLGLRGFEMREEILKSICLTNDDLNAYGGLKTIYGWHISDLKIYDKPKELSEFANALSNRDIRCKHIEKRQTVNGRQYMKCTLQNCICEFRRLGWQTDCIGYEMLKERKPITRASQSWQYVEELEK